MMLCYEFKWDLIDLDESLLHDFLFYSLESLTFFLHFYFLVLYIIVPRLSGTILLSFLEIHKEKVSSHAPARLWNGSIPYSLVAKGLKVFILDLWFGFQKNIISYRLYDEKFIGKVQSAAYRAIHYRHVLKAYSSRM